MDIVEPHRYKTRDGRYEVEITRTGPYDDRHYLATIYQDGAPVGTAKAREAGPLQHDLSRLLDTLDTHPPTQNTTHP